MSTIPEEKLGRVKIIPASSKLMEEAGSSDSYRMLNVTAEEAASVPAA
jgi:hypothetical protein